LTQKEGGKILPNASPKDIWIWEGRGQGVSGTLWGKRSWRSKKGEEKVKIPPTGKGKKKKRTLDV